MMYSQIQYMLTHVVRMFTQNWYYFGFVDLKQRLSAKATSYH